MAHNEPQEQARTTRRRASRDEHDPVALTEKNDHLVKLLEIKNKEIQRALVENATLAERLRATREKCERAERELSESRSRSAPALEKQLAVAKEQLRLTLVQLDEAKLAAARQVEKAKLAAAQQVEEAKLAAAQQVEEAKLAAAQQVVEIKQAAALQLEEARRTAERQTQERLLDCKAAANVRLADRISHYKQQAGLIKELHATSVKSVKDKLQAQLEGEKRMVSQLEKQLVDAKEAHKKTHKYLTGIYELHGDVMKRTVHVAAGARLLKSNMCEQGLLPAPQEKRYLAPMIMPNVQDESLTAVAFIEGDSREEINERLARVGGELVPNATPILVTSENESATIKQSIVDHGNALVKRKRNENPNIDVHVEFWREPRLCIRDEEDEATTRIEFLNMFADPFVMMAQLQQQVKSLCLSAGTLEEVANAINDMGPIPPAPQSPPMM